MNEKVSYVVRNEPADVVINRMRVWLEDRPWTTRTNLPVLGSGFKVVATTQPLDAFNGIACLINLALVVVTLGAWFVIAAVYYILVGLTEPPTIQFEAFEGGEDTTRLHAEVGKIKGKLARVYLAEIEDFLVLELRAEKLAGP